MFSLFCDDFFQYHYGKLHEGGPSAGIMGLWITVAVAPFAAVATTFIKYSRLPQTSLGKRDPVKSEYFQLMDVPS
jgi:hypothetical protein